MNTRMIQLLNKMDEVIKDTVVNGNKPTLTGVLQETVRRFLGHQIGYPLTKSDCAVEHNSPTDPELYNKFFTSAVSDIRILYDLLTDALRRMVLDTDYQLTWRSRIKSKIKRLDSLIQQVSTDNKYIFYDNFADLTNTNIETTTAYVNLPEDLVTLPENTLSVARIYPDIYYYYASSSKQVSSLSNIFDDSINSSWISYIEKDKLENSSVTISIVFKSPAEINKIFLVGLGSKDQMADIEIDGEKLGAQDCNSYKNAAWYFKPKTITGMNIILTKTEADNISGSNHMYYFGLQAFELYKNTYENYGEINSTRIQFKDCFDNVKSINKIKLEADEKLPDDCSVKHYISYNNSNWININNGKEITLNEYQEYEYMLDNVIGEMTTGDRANNLIEVGSGSLNYVPSNAIDVKVFRDASWRCQYYYYDTPAGDETIPTLSNFENNRDIQKCMIRWFGYNDNQEFGIFSGKTCMLKFTTYIKSGSTSFVKSLPINQDFADMTKRNIYLNGSQIYAKKIQSNGIDCIEYHLTLKEGYNEFNFVTNEYTPSYKDYNGRTIMNSDLQELEDKLLRGIVLNCDKQPMVNVSLYELLYNTRPGDHSRFAVSNSGSIYLNYGVNIRHKLQYKCIPENKKISQLYYKAILKRNDGGSVYFTPQLRSVKITVSE